MKLNRLLLISVFCILAHSQTALAYEIPSDGDLDKVLANPKMISTLLDDADGKQVAELLKRLIERIEASSLGKEQKDYLIAFYTGRIVFLLNAQEAIAFATELIAIVPGSKLPIVFAGLATGGGGSSDFMTTLRTLAGESASLNTAISTPNITLTTPVYSLLLSTLGSAQTLPPTATDSLPPPVVTDTGASPAPAPPPPVIPPGYAGQG